MRCMLIIFTLVSICVINAQPSIIQNIYSDEASDGYIVFDQNQQHIIAYYDLSYFFIGDLYDDWINSMCAHYGYLSFIIPEPIDGYYLDSAVLNYKILQMFGDNITHEYPQFNLPGGLVEPPLLIEHIDFGSTITWEDLNPTILDEPVVMIDSLVTGWQTFPLTDYVHADMDSGRNYTQYRIKMQYDSDWDALDDCIMIGYYFSNSRPYLALEFVSDSTEVVDVIETPTVLKLVNTPNPFTINTTISFELSKSEMIYISIYNLQGKLITTIINGVLEKGIHNFVWNGKDDTGHNVSSGVYFYKLNTNEKCLTNKMLLLK